LKEREASLEFLSPCLFVMDIRFDAMFCSNLGNEVMNVLMRVMLNVHAAFGSWAAGSPWFIPLRNIMRFFDVKRLNI